MGIIMTNAGVSPQQQHRSFSIISQMPGWVTLLTPPPGPAWCGGWALLTLGPVRGLMLLLRICGPLSAECGVEEVSLLHGPI